jgi:hypothetical protein
MVDYSITLLVALLVLILLLYLFTVRLIIISITMIITVYNCCAQWITHIMHQFFTKYFVLTDWSFIIDQSFDIFHCLFIFLVAFIYWCWIDCIFYYYVFDNYDYDRFAHKTQYPPIYNHEHIFHLLTKILAFCIECRA